jgi:hypothetical protein
MKLQKAPDHEFVDIERFGFEDEFVGQDIRCIPMIVRLKMDRAGIKLKLLEWSKFNGEERVALAVYACETQGEVRMYHTFLRGLILKYTGRDASPLPADPYPAWSDPEKMPVILHEKAAEFGWRITGEQWKGLTDLQRFALLKLSRPGHENRNFPKAMREFKLVREDDKEQSN